MYHIIWMGKINEHKETNFESEQKSKYLLTAVIDYLCQFLENIIEWTVLLSVGQSANINMLNLLHLIAQGTCSQNNMWLRHSFSLILLVHWISSLQQLGTWHSGNEWASNTYTNVNLCRAIKCFCFVRNWLEMLHAMIRARRHTIGEEDIFSM